MNVFSLMLFFSIYSFLGWIAESVFCSFLGGKFVSRGFLVGPYCPIYGFGATLILLLLMPFSRNLLLIFVLGMVLTSSLEYLSSYLLEKLFHKSWWDYSNHRFHVNGRISLVFSLVWGASCVFLVYILHPLVNRILRNLTSDTVSILALLLLLLFLGDLAYSIRNTLVFNREMFKITMLSDQIDKLRSNLRNAADKTKSQMEMDLSSLLSQHEEAAKYFVRKMRRLLNAFPRMKLTRKDTLSIRERINAYRSRK